MRPGDRVTRRWIAAGVVVVALVVAGWLGLRSLVQRRDAAAPTSVAAIGDNDDTAIAGNEIETVAATATALPTGGTPMAERIAVVGLLNKRNGVSRELTLHPGQAARVGDVVVRVRACEQTAPWEDEALTGAFVQLDLRGVDRHWRRVFSGWLYKERPALNVVQQPVYDVWAKSCTMSWPATGPDTTSLAVPPSRSSARKSPAADDSEPDDGPTTPASAPVSNAT